MFCFLAMLNYQKGDEMGVARKRFWDSTGELSSWTPRQFLTTSSWANHHIIHQLAVQIIKKSANVLNKVPGVWALAAFLIDG